MSSDSDSDASDYEDVRPYFPAAQWDDMSNYEKSSYRSAKENYNAMQAAGLAPRPPHFMVRKPVPAQRKQPAAFKAPKRRRSVDEDEEWTPAQEEQPRPSRRTKFVPPRQARPKQSQRAKKVPAVAVAVPDEKQPDEAPTGDGGPAARYPKRAGTRKCYAGAEEAVHDDDELFCDDCARSWEGDCPVHGPLLVISDTKVEPKDPQRALHSVPPQLAVLESKIEGAGKGVWTKVAVPKRVRFGPYEGDITPPNSESGYGWEIRRDGKALHCIDALRESTSNWMRYVNCPRNVTEANLHPYQFKGSLFYRTVRDVPPNTELLVWYGDSYGKDLGIDPKAFRAPPANPHALNGTFPCGKCNACFVSPLLLSKHELSGKCSFEIRRRRSAAAGGTSLEGPRAAGASDAAARPGGKHTCSSCGAAFDRGSNLRVHQRMHTGEKPFACTVCNKAFKMLGNLRVHQRVHTGEKPFACTVCNKAFTTLQNLQTHQRGHTGEKPFACTVCKKAFNHLGHLQEHQRVHTGEKPFACSLCKKTFSRVSHCRSHERTHTREEPFIDASEDSAPRERKRFSCVFCVSTFSRDSDRRRHEQRKHAAPSQQPAPVRAAVESAPQGLVAVQAPAPAADEPDSDAVSSTTTQPARNPPPSERALRPLEPVQEPGVSSTSQCSGLRKREGGRRPKPGGKENRPPSI